MTLAGIFILPFYLNYMGAEAYGLVGFFTALQSWFNMLDLGLSPSVSRQTARMNAGALPLKTYLDLIRALQLIFFIIMLIGTGILFLLAPYIAHSWLKAQSLPINEVQTAVQLMAVSVGLRWMCGIYRATVTGSEQFVWLSYYTWVFTTLRYLGVLLVLMFVGTTPFIFFTYQIVISLFELTILALKATKNLPILPKSAKQKNQISGLLSTIKPIIPFALSVFVTSSIWIVITQTDKLILSKLLPLTEYGYFTLAVLAANGVTLFSAPFSMVLMPRMAKIKAEKDEKNLIYLYRQATKYVASVTIPAGIILALFPEEILWLWTNNLVVAHQTAPVLRLYALGNAILAFTTFPYYLQYAHGNLRWHLIGNSCFAIALIPSIIWATTSYGMIGAAWVWLTANLSFFSIWTAFVHKRLIKNIHLSWLFGDFIPIIITSLVSIFGLNYCISVSGTKLSLILEIGLIATSTVLFNLIFIKLTAILRNSSEVTEPPTMLETLKYSKVMQKNSHDPLNDAST
jgi:O-antigen/teichoic acid export membrane protein